MKGQNHDNAEHITPCENHLASVTDEQVGYLMAEMLKEVFIEAFERRFDTPDASVMARINQAHLRELKEWIPNIVEATKPEDVFISSLERVLVRFTAASVKRRFNVDVGNVMSLSELQTVFDVKTNGVTIQSGQRAPE